MSDNIQPDGSWRDPNAQMAIDIGQGKVNPSMAGYSAVQMAHQMYGSAHVNGLWGHHGNAPPAPPSAGSGWYTGSAPAPSYSPGVRRPSPHPAPAWGPAMSPQAAPGPAPRRRLLRVLVAAVLAAGVYALVVHPVATALVIGPWWPGAGYALLHLANNQRFPSHATALALPVANVAQATHAVTGTAGARMHLPVLHAGRTSVVATDGRVMAGRLLDGRPLVVGDRRWIAIRVAAAGRPASEVLLNPRDLQPLPGSRGKGMAAGR